MIHLIDRRVVRQAINLIASYQRGVQPSLEVNLSGRAFADTELLPLIQSELERTRIDPGCLILEITETAAIVDLNQAQQFIQTLKGLGCRFAIADFGVGFSYYLKYLPVDYVKIDGSFIRNLSQDTVDQHPVKALIEVAHGLGKETIAEWVNGEETLHLLQEYGADYAQGYHIGAPRPVSELLLPSFEGASPPVLSTAAAWPSLGRP